MGFRYICQLCMHPSHVRPMGRHGDRLMGGVSVRLMVVVLVSIPVRVPVRVLDLVYVPLVERCKLVPMARYQWGGRTG